MLHDRLAVRVAELEAEVSDLRRRLSVAQVVAATAVTDARTENWRHAGELAAEAGRADRAEARSIRLVVENNQLLTDTAFVNSILEASNDCIKVLDLDGTLKFMSAGGMRVMEVDDPSVIVGCAWPNNWSDEGRVAAQQAIARALLGESSHFEAPCPTAKGNMRWWDVTVTPIFDENRSVGRILSISRDITARRNVEMEREELLREMHHRVLNTLATVSAIVSQSMNNAPDMATARDAVGNRIAALAKAHSLLVTGTSDAATVQDVIRGAIEPYDHGVSRFDIDGPALAVGSKAALALALAVNELGTNATKYGALSTPEGRVAIAWRVDEAEGRFHLTWREQGGPAVAAPSRRGLGSRLIEQGFAKQLGGNATLAFEPSGVTCAFDVPLESIRNTG